MTPLDGLIRETIARDGPMRLDHYMALCLQHCEHGYYRHAQAIGAAGDFTTAPEISQMFGELLGLWLADRWLTIGRPEPFHYVEFGPGRGTLSRDVGHAIRVVPGLSDQFRAHLFESNRHLRAQQYEALPEARFFDDAADLPDGPVFLLANEFFDALPIRQCRRSAAGWRETAILLNDDELAFTEIATDIPEAAVPAGATVEFCPDAEQILAVIARHIAAHGGAALIIDYGYSGPAAPEGGSFQAVAAHGYADPLKDCGRTDLTAHVAFDRLIAAARATGCAVAGPATQADLLNSLGIGMRADMLIKANPTQRTPILRARDRLTAEDQMGTLFKAIALVREGGMVPGVGTAA